MQLAKLEELHPSTMNARKTFDAKAIDDLSASIAIHGILQDILVRPRKEGGYEIVAGERRFRAAKKLNLAQVPIKVKELSDQDVLEIVLIENVQREDLTELEEADGYAELVTRCKLTVDQIVERTGKKKGTIYARLKLTQLGPEGREALTKGVIETSTALFIARFPKSVQPSAVKAALPLSEHDHVSFREAKSRISRACYRDLDSAAWKLDDTAVVKDAPACKACPSNSRNMPKEERPDHRSADVCTSIDCWDRKLDVVYQLRVKEAESFGGGAAPKKALDNYGPAYGSGYVTTDKRPGDGRTPREKAVFYAKSPHGKLFALIKEGEAKPTSQAEYDRREKVRREKEKEKSEAEAAKFEALLPGIEKAPTVPDWFWQRLYERYSYKLPTALKKKLKPTGAGARTAALLAFLAAVDDKPTLEIAAKTWATPAPASSSKAAAKPAKAKTTKTKAAAKKGGR